MAARPAQPSYDYVRRTYGVSPDVGARVRHLETKRFGVILPEGASHKHYVRVCFDGERHASFSHPTALEYSPAEAAA